MNEPEVGGMRQVNTLQTHSTVNVALWEHYSVREDYTCHMRDL